MKKTRIIATYGPAIASESSIRKLISAGVNIFRINCSHGEKADFVAATRKIRRGSAKNQFPVGILFDISGPKLRLGHFENELSIRRGERLTLVAGTSVLDEKKIGVNHPAIIESIKKGERLFIDDGNLRFTVLSTGKKQVVIAAENDGLISGGKGINLPDTKLSLATITKKDKEDIATAVECGADFIALSFVRSGDDIIEARRIIKRLGGKQLLIAKLEKSEAIDQLEEILLLSDGVMVARGDLGVELPPEDLPYLQKRIIHLANRQHKPVIVATQMLESMRFHPRATRAEINDVASAVFDFVDAVMLSAETATGKYSLQAVQTMSRVIETTEANAVRPEVDIETHLIGSEIPHLIAEAVSHSERHLATKTIFAFTTSGFTATLISNLFPPQIIVALTSDKKTAASLLLCRGVYPVVIRQPASFETMRRLIEKVGSKYNFVKKDEKIIITGGLPFGSTAPTNFMMYHIVGQKFPARGKSRGVAT